MTGNWVGTRHVQQRQATARSELHLIVDTPGGPTAYLVCAWLRVSLADSLAGLAAATDLALETVEQPDVDHGPGPARLAD